MKLVDFRGRAGVRLCENVAGHLHLIEQADSLRALHKDDFLDAAANMVAFMVTAAWGYNRVSDLRYGSRAARFRYLSAINPHIYRIAFDEEPLLVRVDTGNELRTFSLGHASGFSAVIPLTDRGFRDYMCNHKAMTELAEGDIVPHPYVLGSIDYVLVAGVVDFCSLPQFLAGDTSFTANAAMVLGNLAEQIGRFLPRVELRRYPDAGDVYAVPIQSRRLPVVVCPMVGVGMGENMLRTAGFEPCGTDKGGNPVWLLDFADFDSGLDRRRFRKIFKAHRYLNKYRQVYAPDTGWTLPGDPSPN